MSQGAIAFEQTATQAVPSLAVEEAPTLADTLPPSYIIKTTKLLNPAGELTPGELHVENGKIVARLSREVPTFDLGDAVVTPGLVAAHHPLFSGDTADADAGQLCAADFLVRNESIVGDGVLLSPGCTGYDQFRDFEERGARFTEAVLALQAAGSRR